jgi:2-polyprenyl-3-methyl-5-hydroxy-6-metoxy-1,4-benzoquinol methylase
MSDMASQSVSGLMDSNLQNTCKKSELVKFSRNSNKFIENFLFVVLDGKINSVISYDDFNSKFSGIKDEYLDISGLVNYEFQFLHEDDNAAHALYLMCTMNIKILPVINETGSLKGYLSFNHVVQKFSPERQYLNTLEYIEDDNVIRHISRYEFAKNFISERGYYLDCACGSGYGTKILADKAKKILGVDISEDAVSYANTYNKNENTEFMAESIDNLKFPDGTFDGIISIETLEHIPKESFINWLLSIKKWLKVGGVFIGSSPMLRFKNEKPYITNPYHINEMPKQEFIDAINETLTGFKFHYYFQDQNSFYPLCDENTGFCIVAGRKHA